jgi:hypothetical protein
VDFGWFWWSCRGLIGIVQIREMRIMNSEGIEFSVVKLKANDPIPLEKFAEECFSGAPSHA